MRTRADVVAAARALIGVPFRHQGRTVEGVDCAGLVVLIARNLGLAEADVSGYNRRPGKVGGERIEQVCERYMHSLDPRYMSPGDVGLFQFVGRPWHMAVLADYGLGDLAMIHAYEPAGAVIETRLDAAWRARLVAAYALPRVY